MSKPLFESKPSVPTNTTKGRAGETPRRSRADLRSLAVTEENLQNQIAVVKEEIRVNVLNQPYGGFPFIMLPELAYDRYPNSHNGYGDFDQIDVGRMK